MNFQKHKQLYPKCLHKGVSMSNQRIHLRTQRSKVPGSIRYLQGWRKRAQNKSLCKHLILLSSALLYFLDYHCFFFVCLFFFYKLKVSGNSVGSIFQQNMPLFVSVSHVGNSKNNSNFFIIILPIMVICDQ